MNHPQAGLAAHRLGEGISQRHSGVVGTVEPDHDPAPRVFRHVPDDHDGRRHMTGQIQRERTEQQAAEATEPTAADHDLFGVLGLTPQDLAHPAASSRVPISVPGARSRARAAAASMTPRQYSVAESRKPGGVCNGMS
nr:hypothetical protein GCM10020093_020300 [Planobispora longispora]